MLSQPIQTKPSFKPQGSVTVAVAFSRLRAALRLLQIGDILLTLRHAASQQSDIVDYVGFCLRHQAYQRLFALFFEKR